MELHNANTNLQVFINYSCALPALRVVKFSEADLLVAEVLNTAVTVTM